MTLRNNVMTRKEQLMNNRMNTLALATIAAVWVTAGCERSATSSDQAAPDSSSAGAAALPAGLFVDQAPPDARGVGDLRADVEATGEVVIHGRIGGRAKPFVDGVAMFLLADVDMKSCDELGGACPVPWDFCCEPPESLAAKIATIQIADAEGKPLRISVEGQNGLLPLAVLTIAGEVAQRDGGSLVINARKIHVAKRKG